MHIKTSMAGVLSLTQYEESLSEAALVDYIQYSDLNTRVGIENTIRYDY